MAKHRCAEREACSPGDSVVTCDVFLARGEDMRPYVRDVTQKKWRSFYGLPINAASIRILASGVKPYACESIQKLGRQTTLGYHNPLETIVLHAYHPQSGGLPHKEESGNDGWRNRRL